VGERSIKRRHQGIAACKNKKKSSDPLAIAPSVHRVPVHWIMPLFFHVSKGLSAATLIPSSLCFLFRDHKEPQRPPRDKQPFQHSTRTSSDYFAVPLVGLAPPIVLHHIYTQAPWPFPPQPLPQHLRSRLRLSPSPLFPLQSPQKKHQPWSDPSPTAPSPPTSVSSRLSSTFLQRY